jgi:hypothetical protein
VLVGGDRGGLVDVVGGGAGGLVDVLGFGAEVARTVGPDTPTRVTARVTRVPGIVTKVMEGPGTAGVARCVGRAVVLGKAVETAGPEGTADDASTATEASVAAGSGVALALPPGTEPDSGAGLSAPRLSSRAPTPSTTTRPRAIPADSSAAVARLACRPADIGLLRVTPHRVPR